jgi:thiol-disulfide isomerase/thioredoxin
MHDDPVRRALDLLDRPMTPDPAFKEALFQHLREEAGRPSRGRRTPVARRGAHRALLAAAVLAVTVAIFTVTLGPLANLGNRTPPVSEIVPGTPFSMTIDGSFPPSPQTDLGGDYRIRVSWNGSDAWRIDVLGGTQAAQPLVNENVTSAGSYVIWDGSGLAGYDAASSSFVPQPAHPTWFSPLNLLSFDDPRAGWSTACAGVEPARTDEIAGRPVNVLRCTAPPGFASAAASYELWVDGDSRLILKLASLKPPIAAPSALPDGPLAWYEGEQFQAGAITYDPVFAAGTFRVPSAPSASPSVFPPLTGLTIGQEVPPLKGVGLDGTPFDLAALRGKPVALYLWADWCVPCGGTPLDALNRIAATDPGLDVVTVGVQVEPSSIRPYVEQHGWTLPVVLPNPELSSKDAWGITGVPTLILIDADGHFVGAYEGWNAEIGTAGDIAAVIDALVSDKPLPDEKVFSEVQI